MDEPSLLSLLRARKLTLATAESCTGGLLGSALTAVPGSSEVYRGGVISYCNAVKHRLLGVPLALLEEFGAVSWQVAEAMAHGAAGACGADVGVGITGIAGPDSDETGRPVGLVYVGYCDGRGTTHIRLDLNGTREEIRRAACREALRLIAEQNQIE
ncbi:MAG: CinA family protein [Oscillospiraceae bacterium]|nr:CinA family protein [Oscillospiraceae bacterium]